MKTTTKPISGVTDETWTLWLRAANKQHPAFKGRNFSPWAIQVLTDAATKQIKE